MGYNVAYLRPFHMRRLIPRIQNLVAAHHNFHARVPACQPQTPFPSQLAAPRSGFIMKRYLTSAPSEAKTEDAKPAKPARAKTPEYHETPSLRDEAGEIIWPAPRDEVERARDFIRECVASRERILIVPDKDADGLSAGVILQKTLLLLGVDPNLIWTHFLQKGCNVHEQSERESMAAYKPAYIFILDQGSRKAPPVIDAPHKALIIDHHFATEEDFPEGSQHVNACNSPPIVTSSLLTYLICEPLHEDVAKTCDWVCVIGTHGDLGNSLKWEPPFPDMKACFKKYTKSAINTAVSLINAPRRTAAYDVAGTWETLRTAEGPKDMHNNEALLEAKAEVKKELERCAHTAPKFSADGKVATFRISSEAQVHPLIAMRWAGYLESPELEIILVANEGYLPGLVSFSCRIAKCARYRDPPVNILETLQGIAARSTNATFRERLGGSFAKGHKEASGGIVPRYEFEEFMELLEIDKPKAKPETEKTYNNRKIAGRGKQSNKLTNYFGVPFV